MKQEYISASEKQTIAFAKSFAKTLSLPAVISLEGDLGAGKTTFTKGLALGIGVQDIVTSPTFTILNELEGSQPLYHFDMYRLGSLAEAQEMGFHEYFAPQTMQGLVVCEWASNVRGILPPNAIVVKLTKLSETKRKIQISEAENI